MQTKSTPLLDPDAGGGGTPFTMTLAPKMQDTYGIAHIGNIHPMSIRMIARMIPIGIQRMMRRAVEAVGRFTSLPS